MRLNWLSFQIHIPDLSAFISANIPQADGILADESGFEIIEVSPFQQEQIDLVNNYLASLTESAENAKIERAENLAIKIKELVEQNISVAWHKKSNIEKKLLLGQPLTTQEEDNLIAGDPVFTQQETIMLLVANAMDFGNNLILEFAAENILMGITQAGKTKDVADYLSSLMRYTQTGSLYEVMAEIDRLIQTGLPPNLSPFITEERLLSFKTKVLEYLA